MLLFSNFITVRGVSTLQPRVHVNIFLVGIWYYEGFGFNYSVTMDVFQFQEAHYDCLHSYS